MDEILDNKATQYGNSNFPQQKILPNATATLVLGIISIVTCFLYGIPGLICGIISVALFNKDKKRYEEEPEAYANSFKNAKAGQICGIIGLSLSALYIIILLGVVGVGLSSRNW